MERLIAFVDFLDKAGSRDNFVLTISSSDSFGATATLEMTFFDLKSITDKLKELPNDG